jgi:hypothetical protein
MRKVRRSSRTAVFAGILIAVASAILGLWLGGDKVSPGESVLIGVVGLVLSLQLDILLRMDRRDQLTGLIDGPPWVAAQMTRISSSLEAVTATYGDTIVVDEAEQRLAAFAVEFDELAQGRVRTGAEDVRYLMAATMRCKRELVGITNLQPNGDGTSWWDSAIGQNYWRENVAAIRRGVRVGRIFITDDDHVSDALETIVSAQCDAGADVYVIPRHLVPMKYQRNIAIWDSDVAWEADMNAAGLAIEYVYAHSRHDIERLRRIYDVLHHTALAREHNLLSMDPDADGQDLPLDAYDDTVRNSPTA